MRNIIAIGTCERGARRHEWSDLVGTNDRWGTLSREDAGAIRVLRSLRPTERGGRAPTTHGCQSIASTTIAYGHLTIGGIARDTA